MRAWLIGLLLLFADPPVAHPLGGPQPVKPGDTVTVVTAENRARLCPEPNCPRDAEILRIPTGTKLQVLEHKVVQVGGRLVWDVVWYRVRYQDREGWISEFCTDRTPRQYRYK